VDSNAFISTKLKAGNLLSSYRETHRSNMALACTSVFGDESASPVFKITDSLYEDAVFIPRFPRSKSSPRSKESLSPSTETAIDLEADE